MFSIDSFFIFGAKYLYLVMLVIAGLSFFRLEREKQKDLVILAIISFPLIFLAAKIGAYVYFDPRPFVVGHFTPLVAHEPDNGFPSDHALLLSSVTMLFVFYQRRISCVLLTLTAIVACSRVYVGIHHFVDVLASVLMAVTIVALVQYVLVHFKLYSRIQQI